MSREVNEGIKKGIRAGVITNVSLLVNMPYFDDAIVFLKKNPQVSVGLHFNITEGAPISHRSEVGSLVREDGNFYYWVSLIYILIKNKNVIGEIEKEFNMQYEKLKRSGIKISYLDSHHHVHMFPPIFKLFLNFALKHKIQAIRGRSFKLTFPLFSGTIPSLKQLIITSFCILNNILFHNNRHFFENDHLYDINWHPNMDKKQFLHLLDNISEGKTQMICHPGVMSKTGNRKFLEPRHRELSLLLDREVQKKILQYS
jgi:predicted glycoside hydrolase/deacetylase ChbG (UPF0249 family)